MSTAFTPFVDVLSARQRREEKFVIPLGIELDDLEGFAGNRERNAG